MLQTRTPHPAASRRDASATEPGEPAIATRGIRHRFGGRWALDGVSLRVRAGEVYGFLGPNGAGKSTLCRILCTLLKPTEGAATVAGYDLSTRRRDIRLRIGAALQSTALDQTQTAREMLELQGKLYGLDHKQVSRRIGELGELIDLGDALHHRVGTYSGGMRRRLDLALALIHNPSLVFLDEPTTALDPASRARLWSEIRRLNHDAGITIFLTTQYMEEADKLAHRVGFISHGRLVAEGSPAELKRSVGTDLVVATIPDRAAEAPAALTGLPPVRSVAVQGSRVTIAVTDGSAAVSPIAVALTAAGLLVQDLTLRCPTLDDVFLSMTGEHVASRKGTRDE